MALSCYTMAKECDGCMACYDMGKKRSLYIYLPFESVPDDDYSDEKEPNEEDE